MIGAGGPTGDRQQPRVAGWTHCNTLSASFKIGENGALPVLLGSTPWPPVAIATEHSVVGEPIDPSAEPRRPHCLPAFLPSCLPAFLPSCLPALLAYWLTGLLANSPAPRRTDFSRHGSHQSGGWRRGVCWWVQGDGRWGLLNGGHQSQAGL